MPIEQICGNAAPLEFSNYMHYVRALRFEDRPDYNNIRYTFKKLMRKEGFEYDHMFDWVIQNPQVGSGNLNFSVESFDEIKQSNRKKKMDKQSTKGGPKSETSSPRKNGEQDDEEEKE